MIIKSYETKSININKNPFILLYGNNEGLKNQTKIDLLQNKTIVSNYEENEIINNPNIFFEKINSKSFFENEQIITIARVTDKIFNIINEVVGEKQEDLIIILDAGNLDKKSKLRSLFEKSKKLISIPFYPDTNDTLSKLTFNYFKKKNITVSQSNINLIVDKCNGDRKILFSEIEKIENFTKSGKKINTQNILQLINLIENHNISELIDNCLANNKNKTVNILIENKLSKEDCIIITRVFINKLKKLLNLCTEFEKNKNLNLTISGARPPIFWKDKEITKKHILNWTPKTIKETLFKVNEIELLIKKNYDNSIYLITDLILNLVSKKI